MTSARRQEIQVSGLQLVLACDQQFNHLHSFPTTMASEITICTSEEPQLQQVTAAVA